MKNATIITATFAALLMTSMMSGTASAAQQCSMLQTSIYSEATGAFKGARVRRATRKAKRAWEAYILGSAGPSIFTGFTNTNQASYGLGSRFADLDNAKNVVINCKGAGRGKTRCTVTAAPCTK